MLTKMNKKVKTNLIKKWARFKGLALKVWFCSGKGHLLCVKGVALLKFAAKFLKAVALPQQGRRLLWLLVLLLPVFILLRSSRSAQAIWAPTLGSWSYRQQLN